MTSNRAFPGRVIFDHLPKTAGQAINAWLVEALGAGCVTPNLNGNHRYLIRQFGGLNSVICGHVQFQAGEGLDPRYQYMTILREPVDRVVSWLYFVVNNHDDSQLPELRESAKYFLENDGRDIPEALVGSIVNVCAEHFCRINGNGLEADDEKIANALAAIKEYDIVGTYEEMPRFLAGVASLIGLPPPQEIARVNVTARRPKIDQVSPILRERIVALNQLDLRLYAEVVAWTESIVTRKSTQALPFASSKWMKYEPAIERIVTTPNACILSAVLREGFDIRHGQLLTFDVDFFLAKDVHVLETGIHLFDSEMRWAFGINSTMLGQSRQSLPSGAYRVSYHLIADLPAGQYTAGFAFAEGLPDGHQRELAWRDVMCAFQVHHHGSKNFAGYANLPAEISLYPIETPTRYSFPGDDTRLNTTVGARVLDNIVSTSQAGCLVFGPYVPLIQGVYHVTIRGTLGAGGLAGAYMDAVANKGALVLAEAPLEVPREDGSLITLSMSLTVSCSDFEVRVWVSDKTDIKISMIELVKSIPEIAT